jgi:hypothetical protein
VRGGAVYSGGVQRLLLLRRQRRRISISRYAKALVLDHVPTGSAGRARIAPMRCALDGRADKVRASVLLSAPLGGARVCASPGYSRLRACHNSRLHGADASTPFALNQAVGAACADGAGLGQQWPGVALLRRAASALNSIKFLSVCLLVLVSRCSLLPSTHVFHTKHIAEARPRS